MIAKILIVPVAIFLVPRVDRKNAVLNVAATGSGLT